MNEEQPVARSSMVPVLGCIALMLFSLSSYKIFDKEFIAKWRSHFCEETPHHYVEVRSLSWAYPQYEEALEIDPAVRADPEMLPDLLEMARSGSLHRESVDLIARVYGPDALPAVERQLAERMRREEQRRLERLAERLGAAP